MKKREKGYFSHNWGLYREGRCWRYKLLLVITLGTRTWTLRIGMSRKKSRHFWKFFTKKSKKAQKRDVKEIFSWWFARFLVCRKRRDITSVESAGLSNCSTSLLSISLNLKFYPKWTQFFINVKNYFESAPH